MIFSLIGAISNAIRGGQDSIWLRRKTDIRGGAINALVFAVVVLVATRNDIFLALWAFPAMWIGAKPGWGDYIGALGGWRAENLKENPVIDFVIQPLKRWPTIWGATGLLLRGLFWGLCLATPFYLYGYRDLAKQFLIASSFMPSAYWCGIKWMKTRVNRADDGWGLGEIFFGAILWSPLGLL